MCVCERERERVCVSESMSERASVCVREGVCVREREGVCVREGVSECVCERASVCVCVQRYTSLCVYFKIFQRAPPLCGRSQVSYYEMYYGLSESKLCIILTTYILLV